MKVNPFLYFLLCSETPRWEWRNRELRLWMGFVKTLEHPNFIACSSQACSETGTSLWEKRSRWTTGRRTSRWRGRLRSKFFLTSWNLVMWSYLSPDTPILVILLNGHVHQLANLQLWSSSSSWSSLLPSWSQLARYDNSPTLNWWQPGSQCDSVVGAQDSATLPPGVGK